MIAGYALASLLGYAIGRWVGKYPSRGPKPIIIKVETDKDGKLNWPGLATDIKQLNEAMKAAGFDRVKK